MDILIQKTFYEFNPDIPIGTKVKFVKKLDPKCRAYDPDIVGIVGTISEVQSRRLYVEYIDSKGNNCCACIDPWNVDQIEIGCG